MSILDFIEEVCVQTAVYWGNPRSDGYGGIIFDDPVEIKCRWDDVAKLITDAKGQTVISQAEVLITQDVVVDGYLYLGALADLDSSEEENPISVSGAHAIKRVDKTPLFKSTDEFVRSAYL